MYQAFHRILKHFMFRVQFPRLPFSFWTKEREASQPELCTKKPGALSGLRPLVFIVRKSLRLSASLSLFRRALFIFSSPTSTKLRHYSSWRAPLQPQPSSFERHKWLQVFNNSDKQIFWIRLFLVSLGALLNGSIIVFPPPFLYSEQQNRVVLFLAMIEVRMQWKSRLLRPNKQMECCFHER